MWKNIEPLGVDYVACACGFVCHPCRYV